MATRRERKFANRMCRGAEQCYWAERLVEGECVNPQRALRGRAKQYAGRYEAAFQNMLKRFERAGIPVRRRPGPKGGLSRTSGCYYLDPEALEQQLG